jgi:acetyl-CoA carboxylase biotin carboxyl carrier protein
VSDLTPDDVKEILRLVEESRFDEFELETPRFSVRFRREPAPERGRPAEEQPSVPRNTVSQGGNGLVDVTAPVVGTFYRAPSPGATPFVEVGSSVAPETQVCIVEVMKLMSSVAAGVAGTVVEICRSDAEPVEYGDVLLRIRPA